MAQDKGHALGWEDEGQVTDNSYEVVPEGTYTYEVMNLKHERFGGSDKMCACPVAALQLKCTNVQTGLVCTGFERLYLNSKVMWRISAFFKSAGLVPADTPEGTSMPMSLFDRAIGCTGTVKVKVTHSKGRDGKDYDNNDFTFLPPQTPAAPPTVPPAAPAAPQQQSWGGSSF